jgi:uncharacterized BrkB/YihY/UPF0761 family membrane protein
MPRTVVKILIGSAVAMVALIILSGVAGYAIGYFFADDPDAMARFEAAVAPVVLGVLGVGLMSAALWTAVLWMRSIDEAAREAHKSAWFWGGSTGMMLGGIAIILSFLPQASEWRLPFTFFDRDDPAIHAAIGAYAMMLLMLVGYGVAWAWWWWKRR